MDPCLLVKTGSDFMPLLMLATVSILVVASLAFSRRKPPVTLFLIAFLFSFGLGAASFAPVAHAQSAPDECIEETAPDDPEDPAGPGVVLGLNDDFKLIQIPDATSSYSLGYLAILSNDNPPDNDPYDWETIDLDIDTAGQQTSLRLPHPDNGSHNCGSININNFGVLLIELNYYCYDSSWNTLPIPSDFSITPFQYTVQTLGGNPAPEPATITIATQVDPVVSTVTAGNDIFSACLINSPTGLNILANDSTTAGTLNPLTIDLDLSKPGIQSSVTIDDYVITVNSLGELSVVAPPTAWYYDFIALYYTVANSHGAVSDVAMIELGCPANG